MDYGGTTYSGSPYSAMELGEYEVLLQLYLIIPNVDLVFFGQIGDIIILPPDIEIPPPHDMQDRRSPCVLC